MKISKEATIILDSKIEEVFPLFGFWEEKKWAYGWNPKLIYPEKPIMQEGTVFTTESAFEDEASYNWIVSKFIPEQYMAEYTNSTKNRIWVIKVQCESIANNKTSATVSYTYIALNKKGIECNQIALNEIFNNDLKDWEQAINHYLKTGETLKP